jgi:glycosyltransferase involved in cell wall biosynthesis
MSEPVGAHGVRPDMVRTPSAPTTDLDGVSIVIPAYNEQQCVAQVVDEIIEVCSRQNIDFEIIVVDDGSDDNTAAALKDKPVHLIRHPENRGYGASIKTGVLSARFPWILITDADGTYPIAQIPLLLTNIEQYDMVVGARVGSNVNIPLIRRPAKWILNLLANYMAQTKIPDINSGFRMFRKSSFLRFINYCPSGFSLTTTITLALLCNNHPVKYVPVDYYKRKGRSKIRPFRDTYNFFLLVIRTIMYFDPLRIFVPIALLLLLSGLIFTAFEIYRFKNITTAAAIFLFAGFQTLILSLLADLIVKARR